MPHNLWAVWKIVQKGCYCKKNYDCNSLFWTSSEAINICVYNGGDGNYRHYHPVLLADIPRTVGINLDYRDPLVDLRPHIKMALINHGHNRGSPLLFDTVSHHVIVAICNIYPTRSQSVVVILFACFS